ncbi:uncharacterized protein [Salvelinus sp. IW2-2015]|uniref:uncharacterized protein n=1 Tax=Salvelinus sp. IW2-2015 TaxID=2691554 RepID=UPI0038D3AC2B
MTDGGRPSRCSVSADGPQKPAIFLLANPQRDISQRAVGFRYECAGNRTTAPNLAKVYCRLAAVPAMTQSSSWPSAAVTLWFAAPSGAYPTMLSGRHRWWRSQRGGCTGSVAGCLSATLAP